MGCGTCGGCGSALERLGVTSTDIKTTTAVRYGKMGMIGEFSHPPDMKFSCGGKLVIATDRGIEIGEQARLTCTGCSSGVTAEKMSAYADASTGDETYKRRAGRILREATESDLSELKHINDTAFDKLTMARNIARELELDMKVVDVEQIFGGERIIFYFMSEERVDFRQLVRQLAEEYQTRIEMRQVGARDEARLLADYETCGRECCCKNFLKTLRPITMSMAKLQKTTLDLSKVSGRCGRLKCCLRFENESYQELNKQLPKNNTWVRTEYAVGKVIDRQVLTQLVKLRPLEGPIITVPIEDIIESGFPPPARPEPEPEKDDAPRPRRSADRSPRGAARHGSPDRSSDSDREEESTRSAEPQDRARNGSDPSRGPGSTRSNRGGRKRRRGRRGKRPPGDPGGSTPVDRNDSPE